MRVIIDATTTQDELKNNGVGVYTRHVITHLVKQFPKTEFKLLMFDSETTLNDQIFELRNVERVNIGKYRPTNYLNSFWFLTQFLPAIRRIKDKGTIYFSPYFWRGLPVFSLPTIVTIHDFAFPKFNIYSQISPIHNLIRGVQYWMEILKCYFAKRVIADSEYTRKEFLHYFPLFNRKKIETIHLGVTLDEHEASGFVKYLPADWKERGYILYIGGGLTKNKNSEGVVESYVEFARELGEDKPPYLVVAGGIFKYKDHNARRFRSTVEKSGQEENIVLTGYYEDKYAFSLIKNALFTMHLSLYEGFGFSVAESMFAGVPVIAHEGSSYLEVVGDGGVLVDGRKPKKVGEVMARLFSDPEYRKELSGKGIRKAAEFTWEKTSRKTHELFEQVYNSQ